MRKKDPATIKGWILLQSYLKFISESLIATLSEQFIIFLYSSVLCNSLKYGNIWNIWKYMEIFADFACRWKRVMGWDPWQRGQLNKNLFSHTFQSSSIFQATGKYVHTWWLLYGIKHIDENILEGEIKLFSSWNYLPLSYLLNLLHFHK